MEKRLIEEMLNRKRKMIDKLLKRFVKIRNSISREKKVMKEYEDLLDK